MSDSRKHQQPGKEEPGEGNRTAAERFNKASTEFVKSGKAEEAAKRAAGQDREEAERSEKAGRSRAREFDPAVHRDYGKQD